VKFFGDGSSEFGKQPHLPKVQHSVFPQFTDDIAMDLSQVSTDIDNLDNASKFEIQNVLQQENQKAEFQKSKPPHLVLSWVLMAEIHQQADLYRTCLWN
jgi:hypothetical protein